MSSIYHSYTINLEFHATDLIGRFRSAWQQSPVQIESIEAVQGVSSYACMISGTKCFITVQLIIYCGFFYVLHYQYNDTFGRTGYANT